MSLFFTIISILILQTCAELTDDKESISPKENLIIYTPQIIEKFSHPKDTFTQGLIFDKDILYESTGIYGYSSIRKMNLSGKDSLEIIKLPSTIFGEGIAIHNHCLYVLSWRENTCLVYDLLSTNYVLKEKIYYSGEGWGLCKDATSFWISSGNYYLTRVSLDDFSILEKRKIFLNEAPLGNLNELEFVNGVILINVWQSNFIAIYDPQKNQTVGLIELEKLIQIERTTQGNVLSKDPEAVPNGIAYHQNSNSLYLTGKNWVNLFKIKLVRKNHTSQGVPQLHLLEKH